MLPTGEYQCVTSINLYVVNTYLFTKQNICLIFFLLEHPPPIFLNIADNGQFVSHLLISFRVLWELICALGVPEEGLTDSYIIITHSVCTCCVPGIGLCAVIPWYLSQLVTVRQVCIFFEPCVLGLSSFPQVLVLMKNNLY